METKQFKMYNYEKECRLYLGFIRDALADEVRAEHVKLSWEAPEDDGGTPIIKYIVRLLDLDYNEWINVCEVCISSSNRKIEKMPHLPFPLVIL